MDKKISFRTHLFLVASLLMAGFSYWALKLKTLNAYSLGMSLSTKQ